MLLFFSYYTKRAKKSSQLQSNRNDQPNPIYEEVNSDYGYSVCRPLHGQREKHDNLPSRVIGENCQKFIKDKDFQQETNVAYGISQTLITSKLQSNRNDQPNLVYEEVSSDYGYSVCKPLHGQREKHDNLPSRVIGENCHKFVKDEDFQQETNVAYGISQTLITSSLVDGNSGESNPGEGNDEIKSQMFISRRRK